MDKHRDARGRWTRAGVVSVMGRAAPRVQGGSAAQDMRDAVAKALARVVPLAADGARTLAAHVLDPLQNLGAKSVREVVAILAKHFGLAGGASSEEAADALEALVSGSGARDFEGGAAQSWGAWTRGLVDHWASHGEREQSRHNAWASNASKYSEAIDNLTREYPRNAQRIADAIQVNEHDQTAELATLNGLLALPAQLTADKARLEAEVVNLMTREGAYDANKAAVDAKIAPLAVAVNRGSATKATKAELARLQAESRRLEQAIIQMRSEIARRRADIAAIDTRMADLPRETARSQSHIGKIRKAINGLRVQSEKLDRRKQSSSQIVQMGRKVLQGIASGLRTAGELRDLMQHAAALRAEFSSYPTAPREDNAWEVVPAMAPEPGTTEFPMELAWVGRGGAAPGVRLSACSTCSAPIDESGACDCPGLGGGRAVWRRRFRGKVGGGPLSMLASFAGLGTPDPDFSRGAGFLSDALGAIGLGVDSSDEELRRGAGFLSDALGMVGLGAEATPQVPYTEGAGFLSDALGMVGLGASAEAAPEGAGFLSDALGMVGLGAEKKPLPKKRPSSFGFGALESGATGAAGLAP